ncbi:MAG: hypothetical protein IKY82_03550 [Alistipes sp.]|nr:hypothetical protein [Alistipes sp.]
MRSYLYTIVAAGVALLFIAGCKSANDTHADIRASVERQMEMYPKSTLRDLYKNYFQDFFGPGHIIANTDNADRYLRYELNNSESFEGLDYEPTGYRGAFYRVNLSVIADGRVPYEKYFDAFVRSVNGIVSPSIEQWRKEWAKIDSIITQMGVLTDTAAADADRATIKQALDSGNAVMHHSEEFNRHYAPHYRIISREIFEQEILPLLGKDAK